MVQRLIKFIKNTHHDIESGLITTCNESDNGDPIIRDSTTYCPRKFEVVCWKEVKAGLSVTRQCPGYIEDFDIDKTITQNCLGNGTWEDLDEISIINSCKNNNNMIHVIIHLCTYGLSTALLLLALCFYWYFRKTMICTRVKLHINLFISKVFSNIIWIITYCTAMNNTTMYFNPVWCQVLHILTYFFTISEYMWILCEGINLNISILHVFKNTDDYFPQFYFLGWGLPGCIIFCYTIKRIFYETSTDKCWTGDDYSFKMITISTCCSLYFSLLLVIDAFRVLYYKYRGNQDEPASPSFVKIVIAGLILIPVFTIYLLFIPIQPVTQTFIESPQAVIYTLTAGLLELVLGYIFCFSHEDFLRAIRLRLRNCNMNVMFIHTAVSNENLEPDQDQALAV